MSYQPNGLHPVTIDLTRSSLSRSQSPLPPAPPDVLKIANAPEDVVRAVLIALCQDPMQKRKAMLHIEKLNKPKMLQGRSEIVNAGVGMRATNGSTNQGESDKESNHYSCLDVGETKKKRRAISEMAICEKCSEPFSEDTNSSEACWYHPGSSVIFCQILFFI